MKRSHRLQLNPDHVDGSGSREPDDAPKKRKLVPVACELCRKGKAKCDGKRPACARCKSKETPCQYELPGGMTRHAGLVADRKQLTAKIEQYEQMLATLKEGSEEEALNQLRNLRTPTTYDGESSPLRRPSAHASTNTVPQSEAIPNEASAEPPSSQSQQTNWHPALRVSYTAATPSLSPTSVIRRQNQPLQSREADLTDSTLPDAAYHELRIDDSLNDTPESFGNLPFSSAIRTAGYPPHVQRHQLLNFEVPEYCIPSLVEPEESIVGKMYLGFRDAALDMINKGTPAPQILGTADSIYVDLFFRNRTAEDGHTVSTWASEYNKTFKGLIDDYVLLANIGLLARFMRWAILPSAANYAQVPEMIRPLPCQRLIPHSPAVDMVALTCFRECLMRQYRDWLTPAQFDSCHTSCWPYTMDEAVERCPETGCLRLTKAFEEYTQDCKNWNMSKRILELYPDVSESTNPITFRNN